MANQYSNGNERLAKAALAKTNNVTYEITGVYENDRLRFQSVSQDFGVTYDANNNVATNGIKSNVATLQASSHTHANKVVLDGVTQTDIDNVRLNTTKIANIAALLGITFDVNGAIVTEDYSVHTHNYDDGGVSEVTGGVN